MSTNPEAPHGYTQAGLPRKRPPPKYPIPRLPRIYESGVCPVDSCGRSFEKRPDPHSAVWQHIQYYFRDNCAERPESPFRAAHVAAHERLMASRQAAERDLVACRQEYWSHRCERRRRAIQRSNLRARARKQLAKEGKEIDEKVVEQMAENWAILQMAKRVARSECQ